MKKVVIAFGSRSRHIFVDSKEPICTTQHKGGYSRGGHYNSYSLDSGVFDTERTQEDVNYSRGGGLHTQGIIPFLPLSDITPKIITSSICKKCQEKYNKLLEIQEKQRDIQ